MQQGLEVRRDAAAEVVEADQELVAELDQDARGGELDVVVEFGCSEGRRFLLLMRVGFANALIEVR